LVIVKAIKKLTDYVGVHFSYEEDLFEKYEWIGRFDHQNKHSALADKVIESMKDLNEKHNEEL